MDEHSNHDVAWTAVLELPPESLARLEKEDLARWRQWHAQAVAALAASLHAGDMSGEPAFLTVLERLGNRLLLDDPEGFATLVDSVADVPTASSAARQLVRYFMGVALARRDQYEAALAMLDELLADPALDDYIHGRALNSRALYCRVTGRLQEAMAGYQASLTLWQQQGNRLREGLAWLNLGNIAHQLQQYDEGETYLNQAMACFEETGSSQWLAAAQSGLGLIYRDRGEWSAAITFFETVAARRQADDARDSWGRILTNISETYLMQGRLDEAMQVGMAALAALETRVYRVDAYLALGLARQVADDLGAAREAFVTALDIALSIGRKDILAEVHYRLGEVLRRLGDDAAALAQFEAAVAVIESVREPLRDEGVKISLLGRWQQVYEALVLHCLALARVADAFHWAERARARAFLEAVEGRLEEKAEAPTPNRTMMIPPDTALLSYFTTGVLDRALPWLRQLPSDSRLRQHLLPPARTLLFCLTADGLAAQECPLNPNDLLWDSPREDDRRRFLDTAVQRYLHDALLPTPAPSAHHVIIAPHGPLHEVPFAALLAANERPWLHEGGPLLAYTPSAAFWQRRATRFAGSTAGQCLTVGYDGPAHRQRLRHTETEARFIAVLTGGEAWVGARPKAGALPERAKGCRWLHVACHGRFHYDAPLDSYLETGPDERLTARQVLAAWQLEVDLVTLSACQTGVSRLLRGDEPMGLVRAFLAVGARAVLVSQWAVADMPTFLLMQQFYHKLMAGVDAAAALHAAQVWLQVLPRHELLARLADLPGSDVEDVPEGPRPFAHPRYWAAFILVGA